MVMDDETLRRLVFDTLVKAEALYKDMGHKTSNAGAYCNKCMVEDVRALAEASLAHVGNDEIVALINEWRENNGVIEPRLCRLCDHVELSPVVSKGMIRAMIIISAITLAAFMSSCYMFWR